MAGRPRSKPAPPFGRRLGTLRRERALSQERLAELLGVSREMVAYYESRATNPTLDFIEQAARVLDVDVAALVADPDKDAAKKRGPASQLELRLARARKLPPKKQALLVRMIDAVLAEERA